VRTAVIPLHGEEKTAISAPAGHVAHSSATAKLATHASGDAPPEQQFDSTVVKQLRAESAPGGACDCPPQATSTPRTIPIAAARPTP
jgi:hypothetical protein